MLCHVCSQAMHAMEWEGAIGACLAADCWLAQVPAGEKEQEEDVEPAEALALSAASYEGAEAAVTSGHLSR